MNETLKLKQLNHSLAQTVNPTSRIAMDGMQWAIDLFGIKPDRHEAGDQVGWHNHEEGHFEILLSGRIRFYSETDSAVLGPSQILFIPPLAKHRWECLEPSVMIGQVVFIEGQRREEMIRFLHQQIPGGLLCVNSREIKYLLNEIVLEGFASKPFKRYVLGQHFFLLACKTLREIPGIDAWSSDHANSIYVESPKQDIVDKIKAYIDEHLADPITLQDIADHVNIGVRHLNRIFYEIEHNTPHRYLLRQRLNYARALILKNPNEAVKKVAFESGFTTNTSYFSRQFKRHYRSLPTAFRDRVRSKR